MGADKHRKRCFLPLYARKIRTGEIDLPAYFFSTDFARAEDSVNECYNTSIILRMNTQHPVFHPNGKRNGSFFLPRPIKKRKGNRKK